MARSLNKVSLIGNLTRDPELRYIPQGAAVCTFGLATNRQWTTDQGEKKESVEFHRIVAWNKLGELCSQLLSKGRKVYVEGRLQTRKWTGQDEVERQTTEVVINDMIILDSRGTPPSGSSGDDDFDIPEDLDTSDIADEDGMTEDGDTSKSKTDSKKSDKNKSKKKSGKSKKSDKKKSDNDEDDDEEDIPF